MGAKRQSDRFTWLDAGSWLRATSLAGISSGHEVFRLPPLDGPTLREIFWPLFTTLVTRYPLLFFSHSTFADLQPHADAGLNVHDPPMRALVGINPLATRLDLFVEATTRVPFPNWRSLVEQDDARVLMQLRRPMDSGPESAKCLSLVRRRLLLRRRRGDDEQVEDALVAAPLQFALLHSRIASKTGGICVEGCCAGLVGETCKHGPAADWIRGGSRGLEMAKRGKGERG